MGRRQVLVFGASGFLGAAVASAFEGDPQVGSLIRAGVRVRDTSSGTWVRHDLVSGCTQSLAELLGSLRPDVIVDCVGRLSGDDSDLVSANTLVTARLIEATAAAVPTARLILLGSAAEYGVVPIGTPVSEDHPINPVSAYGVTKAAATQLARQAAAAGRVDAVVLRVFNPIGAGTPPESLLGRVAAGIRLAIQRGDDVIRLGPLSAWRDFVDVRDVARAVRAVAFAGELGGTVFNVGSGVAVRSREAVELLVKVAGFSGRIEESARAPGRSATVDWIAADISRIQQRVGWLPTHHLAASIETIWDE